MIDGKYGQTPQARRPIFTTRMTVLILGFPEKKRITGSFNVHVCTIRQFRTQKNPEGWSCREEYSVHHSGQPFVKYSYCHVSQNFDGLGSCVTISSMIAAWYVKKFRGGGLPFLPSRNRTSGQYDLSPSFKNARISGVHDAKIKFRCWGELRRGGEERAKVSPGVCLSETGFAWNL